MNKPPDIQQLEDLAAELGVDPAFIEKDWYAIKALQAIERVKDKKFVPVFSGGTSLSKGYALIERFSEDLDFKVMHPAEAKRADLRDYRERVYTAIEASGGLLKIIAGSKMSGDSSRFFECLLEYPAQTEAPDSMRPHLQMQFSFRNPMLDPESRDIRSFATELTQGKPDLRMACVRPLETAVDKINAFVWRIAGRNREAADDDPALIRHLHDLARLKVAVLEDTATFVRLAQDIYEEDKKRTGVAMPDTLSEAIGDVLTKLKQDKVYQTEYEQFVMGVSYAGEERRVSYGEASAAMEELRGLFS